MDERIISTIGELEAFIAGKDDALAIPREAAEFIHALLLSRRARRGVEIGTSYGYSGLWAGAALAGCPRRVVDGDRIELRSFKFWKYNAFT